MARPDQPLAADSADGQEQAANVSRSKGRRLVARNVMSNWIGLASNAGLMLILTPIIVRALRAELYGVWSFLNGLVNYSDLLYLGLGSALVRYVAEAHATGDAPRVSRLTSVVVSIYVVLGFACLVAFAILSGLVPHLFREGLAPAVARSARWTCILLGVRLWLIFIASGFSGLLSGHERFDLVNIVAIAGNVVRFVATWLIVPGAADPLLALAGIVAGTTVLEVGALMATSFEYRPDLTVRLVRPTRQELKLLYAFGLQSFMVLLAFKLISYTDLTVIGLMIGAPAVALYVLPLQLVEYMRMAVGGFANVFLPRVSALVTRGDTPSLRRAYESSTRIAGVLAGWIGGLVVILGPPFLTRWVGPAYSASAGPVLLCLTIAAFAYAISTQAPFPYWQGLNALGYPAAILSVEAAVNLGLSVWLASRMGITGVALATAVPAVGVSLIWLPRSLCRRLDLPWARFVWNCLAPGMLTGVVVAMGEWGLGWVLPGNSYGWLVVRAMASLPVILGLCALTFSAEQKRPFVDLLSRFQVRMPKTLS